MAINPAYNYFSIDIHMPNSEGDHEKKDINLALYPSFKRWIKTVDSYKDFYDWYDRYNGIMDKFRPVTIKMEGDRYQFIMKSVLWLDQKWEEINNLPDNIVINKLFDHYAWYKSDDVLLAAKTILSNFMLVKEAEAKSKSKLPGSEDISAGSLPESEPNFEYLLLN